jgi:hypothetical protein
MQATVATPPAPTLTPAQQAALEQLEHLSRMSNDEVMETILLWHLGFGPGAPVPPPHPGNPTRAERALVQALAHYLNSRKGWQAGNALAEPFRVHITRLLRGTNRPMPGYDGLLSDTWCLVLDGTGSLP